MLHPGYNDCKLLVVGNEPGRSNGLQAVAIGQTSMSHSPEDSNYASFWPDAPMPTAPMELLQPHSAHEQDGVTDRAPQRRRRSSSRYSSIAEDDQVFPRVAAQFRLQRPFDLRAVGR
jgi:hypothetical protein